MRRLPLVGLALLVACGSSSSSDGPGDDATPVDGGGDSSATDGPRADGPASDAPGSDAPRTDGGKVDAPPGDGPLADAPPTDDAPFAAQRAACTFKGGAKPSDTFGPSIATGALPIDTIVIVSQENRSFDVYFSNLPAYGQPDADVAPLGATLNDGAGKPVARKHQTSHCTYDPHHDWDSMHADYDGGKNDKFLSVNGDQAPTIDWYDESDLPFYYALASDYGISDRYFSGLLGPTGPNRLYLFAASSYGHVHNGPGVAPGAPDIFKRLSAAGVKFEIYSAGATGSMGSCPGPYSFERAMFCGSTSIAKTITDFEAAAAAGTLPAVSWIYAGADEHPSGNVTQGEADVQRVYDALAKSPQWYDAATGHGALFAMTYDEAGGFYDHVPPPSACPPDDLAPIVPGEASTPGKFDRYGFRVPLILASPFSRPHYVSHEVASHTSLLRLLELKFSMPAMTARDANAGALLDFFDFTKPAFSTAKIPPKAPAKGC